MSITYINIAFAGYLLAIIIYFATTAFKAQSFFRIATLAFTVSFAFHTISILNYWFMAKRPPFVGMYESLVFFSWAIGLVYLVMKNRDRHHFSIFNAAKDAADFKKNGVCPYFLGIPVTLFIILILGLASFMDKSIKPLMPALKSNWLIIHVTSFFIGYAAVAVSFAASLGYLFQKSANSSTASNLDTLSFRLVVFSFPFLTLGLTTGSVWAKVAWGSYWSWDPKETWALITWCIYAVYLHQRLLKNWQGKKAAYLNIIGFLCVLFTFFGVNYLLKGMHSYL